MKKLITIIFISAFVFMACSGISFGFEKSDINKVLDSIVSNDMPVPTHSNQYTPTPQRSYNIDKNESSSLSAPENLMIKAVFYPRTIEEFEATLCISEGAVTERGDLVAMGHFYADPSIVSWGHQNNPDIYVKIWFDVSGRVDVTFFHTSVPDIEVYSGDASIGTYLKRGIITTSSYARYSRHEYWIDR